MDLKLFAGIGAAASLRSLMSYAELEFFLPAFPIMQCGVLIHQCRPVTVLMVKMIHRSRTIGNILLGRFKVVTRKFGLHFPKPPTAKTSQQGGLHESGRRSLGETGRPPTGRLCFQVLIGDEPEQGMENLMEVEIPLDVEEKLSKADQEEVERGRGETGGGP